jgi:acyl-homoserine-lactone acylase
MNLSQCRRMVMGGLTHLTMRLCRQDCLRSKIRAFIRNVASPSSLWAAQLVLFFAGVSTAFAAGAPTSPEIARWKAEARNVTITRDNWGIAHVHGKTDADAVFGMEYAQAEDDFNRVETNYLNAMGRLAEAEGESAIFQDLRMKLFIDPKELKRQYAESPGWLKALMNSFADGLNYYLFEHPEVKPRVITRFEPWMALSFTEGSIGGDITYIKLAQLQAFYDKGFVSQAYLLDDSHTQELTGSNGIAIAPSNTVDHHALLWINPHTTFYFRSELQMTSDQGLDVYGAVTWGQFFVYQGFNERAGWMHTTSRADDVSEYLETIEKKGNLFYYKYGNRELPIVMKQITVPYKTGHGMIERKFTAYYTQHGPIVREVNGKWVSIRMMNEPIKTLTQSYTRTKARDLKSFVKTMELHTNSSNNTIFADADGDIAFFEGNFIPRRDPRFDWTKPVDGSNPATEWHGLLSVDESPHAVNPASGWVYNCNDWPWAAAGPDSPKRGDYQPYVDNGEETARGRHAVLVLENKKDFTLDSLRDAAFDSYLPWFEKPIPALVKAWEKIPASNPLKEKLAPQIELLRAWDLRWGLNSTPTTLAVFWGTDIRARVSADAKSAGMPIEDWIASRVPPEQLLQSLSAASDKLDASFGGWKTPWGVINRLQRLTGNVEEQFNDAKPSIPIGFTSSAWGSLAAFEARPYPGTMKWYGNSGNSFIAAVEFGNRVRAKAVTVGGESGHPASPHFDDQAQRYATGDLRDVYFYPSDLKGHIERQYHPGS